MNVLKPHLQTTVLTLLAAGKSQREIARVTRVDRKTIRGLVQRADGGISNSPMVATGPAIQIPPPRPPAPRTMCLLWRMAHQKKTRHLFKGGTADHRFLVSNLLKCRAASNCSPPTHPPRKPHSTPWTATAVNKLDSLGQRRNNTTSYFLTDMGFLCNPKSLQD